MADDKGTNSMKDLRTFNKPTAPEKALSESMKMIAFRSHKAAGRELAILAARLGRSHQELLTEALNDLLSKYGSNPIA